MESSLLDNQKGGASLRFTDPRVTFSRKPGPSPLSYDPDLLYGQKCKKNTLGKIHRGKPPRYGCVPSISIPPKLFDGFDIIKGKGLVLRPPRIEFRKPTEPIFRHFPYELCNTTLKYKGNQWSKLRAQRKFILSGDPNSPGVGHYNLLDKPPKPLEVYLDKLRVYNKVVAASSKWNGKVDRSFKITDEPSPCTYEINYEPIYGHHSFNVIGTVPRAERFKDEKIETIQQPLDLFPPPTITSKQKTWPPFNSSSSARPKIQECDTSPAGNCLYNDSIILNLLKRLLRMNVIVPFGSTTERPAAFIPNNHPGPGTYDIIEKPKRTICGVRDSNNYVPPIRLIPLRELLECEVTPWSYDLSDGMKALYKRRDCHKGPTWIKEKHFDRTKWSIKDGPDALYYPTDVGALHCGQPIFNERPKPKNIEITPGPADYHIHPLYTEACLRAHMTQNATSDLEYVEYFTPKPINEYTVRYI